MTEQAKVLHLHSVVCRTEEVISATLGQQVVMLSVNHGAYFEFNETASLIWQLLSEPVSIDQLCAAVQAEYDIDDLACFAAVTAFVQQLIVDNLARVKV